jgi:carbon storage regulator CsrA
MLVVSRKQNQSVVFPTLGIRVEILKAAGKTIRVGIEAPDDIQILRGELIGLDSVAYGASESTAQQKHALRNSLNKANLALTLLQKQLAAGKIDDAEESLRFALETFNELEKSACSTSEGVATVRFSEPSSMVAGKRKKALLVEDDANERMLLAAYLRASGYEVDTAEDGQAALEYLSHNKPDAVVMDMEMPRLNGIECVKEIRSDYRFDDMKLFVVSGMEQRATKVGSGQRGVQRWFQKPLCPDELVDELASSLN